jgi:hypothetical protein
MAAVGGTLIRRRPELRPLALVGMASFTLLYTTLLRLTWWLSPAFASDWNWADLCGLTAIGVPLEEILWAAGYGAVWPLMLGYAFEARIPSVASASPAMARPNEITAG